MHSMFVLLAIPPNGVPIYVSKCGCIVIGAQDLELICLATPRSYYGSRHLVPFIPTRRVSKDTYEFLSHADCKNRLQTFRLDCTIRIS